MSECEDCKRAVRQEGEGAMCFNCYLAKSTPLPTAQEIESDDYSTDQVARMHKRIAELEAENAKLEAVVDAARYAKNGWDANNLEATDDGLINVGVALAALKDTNNEEK